MGHTVVQTYTSEAGQLQSNIGMTSSQQVGCAALCAGAKAMGVIGGRWALLLIAGPQSARVDISRLRDHPEAVTPVPAGQSHLRRSHGTARRTSQRPR